MCEAYRIIYPFATCRTPLSPVKLCPRHIKLHWRMTGKKSELLKKIAFREDVDNRRSSGEKGTHFVLQRGQTLDETRIVRRPLDALIGVEWSSLLGIQRKYSMWEARKTSDKKREPCSPKWLLLMGGEQDGIHSVPLCENASPGVWFTSSPGGIETRRLDAQLLRKMKSCPETMGGKVANRFIPGVNWTCVLSDREVHSCPAADKRADLLCSLVEKVFLQLVLRVWWSQKSFIAKKGVVTILALWPISKWYDHVLQKNWPSYFSARSVLLAWIRCTSHIFYRWGKSFESLKAVQCSSLWFFHPLFPWPRASAVYSKGLISLSLFLSKKKKLLNFFDERQA